MNGKLERFERAAPVVGSLEDFVAKCIAAGHSERDARKAYKMAMACEIWKNDEYQVAIDKGTSHGFGGVMWHLSIRRLDREPVHDWRDLQAIKNELCGLEVEALELYPAESRVVDGANQFHLWAWITDGEKMNPMFPLGWIAGMITDTAGAAALGAKQRDR